MPGTCVGLRLIFTLLAGLLFIAFAAPVRANNAAPPVKLALVIGNSDYDGGWVKLTNPVRDAQLVSTALTGAGFTVLPPAINLPKARLLERLAEFRKLADALPENSIALIYYSGHGIQVSGENYLIPLGARTPAIADTLPLEQREAWLAREYVTVDMLMQQFGRVRASKSNVANVLILDACRENPWDQRTKGFSRTKGLADLPNVANTLIAFAAAPGTQALDGDGKNSPYAAALVRQLGNRHMPLELLFNNVTTDVLKQTSNMQRPDFRVGLAGFYCFDGCSGGAVDLTGSSAPSSSGVKGALVPPLGDACKFCIDTVSVMVGGKELKVGRTQITLGQWRACVADLACPSRGDDDDDAGLPVTKVSWIDVSSFITWISGRTGRTYRLMSSIEWDALVAADGGMGGAASFKLQPVSATAAGKTGIVGLGRTLEWTESCNDGASPCETRIARGPPLDDPRGKPTASYPFSQSVVGGLLSFRLIEAD